MSWCYSEGDVATAQLMMNELTEFSDEIKLGYWRICKIGLDTAKVFWKQDVKDLVRRTDLEEETILDVMRILKEEDSMILDKHLC
jgi:hypothetical protein